MIPHIDQEMEIQDTMIQQVFLTSVPPPLPMVEDDVTGSILKSDVQKEYYASPPVALWDSWFYRGWKADRAMVQPLAEIGNTSWVYFRSSFYGGRNVANSCHRSPLVKSTRDPHISITDHGSRASLSVTLTKAEGSTLSNNINGMTRGETFKCDGTVSGDYRYRYLSISIFQLHIA